MNINYFWPWPFKNESKCLAIWANFHRIFHFYFHNMYSFYWKYTLFSFQLILDRLVEWLNISISFWKKKQMNISIGKWKNFFGVFLQKIWQIALLDNEHELVFSMLGSLQSKKYTKTSEEENVAFSIQKLKSRLESCSATFS